MSTHYEETKYGFEWGAVKVERAFSDEKKGWVTLIVTTPKHPRGIQVYVTKTGKVRVHGSDGNEWKGRIYRAQYEPNEHSTNNDTAPTTFPLHLL